MIRQLLFIAALVATAANTAMPASAAGMELAGTAWQLLSIQSMDDAQGTTKVADPSHFMLEFGRDGRAALSPGFHGFVIAVSRAFHQR